MKKVGLGLIGLGYMGKIHLRNSLKLTNAYVAGVADISKKRLYSAKKMGAKKTFYDYAELLKDPSIDCVVIALPTHLHLQCAQIAAESKKNILLEKPIARNIDEAKQIISAVRKNFVKLMIGYPMRFNPTFRNLKKQIDGGLLGDVEIAQGTNIGSGPFFAREETYSPAPVPDWWFDPELTGGGVLIDLGSHMINLLRWYFGEIIDIKSRLRRRFKMPFEDSATCLVTFESGTSGLINVGWFSQEYRLGVELFGTVKHAAAYVSGSNPLLAAAQTLIAGTPQNLQPFLSELQHFINFAVKDVPPVSSGEDGLKDLEAISLAYEHGL
jgi:predicted dehydrogenase